MSLSTTGSVSTVSSSTPSSLLKGFAESRKTGEWQRLLRGLSSPSSSSSSLVVDKRETEGGGFLLRLVDLGLCCTALLGFFFLSPSSSFISIFTGDVDFFLLSTFFLAAGLGGFGFGGGAAPPFASSISLSSLSFSSASFLALSSISFSMAFFSSSALKGLLLSLACAKSLVYRYATMKLGFMLRMFCPSFVMTLSGMTLSTISVGLLRVPLLASSSSWLQPGLKSPCESLCLFSPILTFSMIFSTSPVQYSPSKYGSTLGSFLGSMKYSSCRFVTCSTTPSCLAFSRMVMYHSHSLSTLGVRCVSGCA
mmetsp:Transcript_19500/g.40367  ORF Transcript_19500/g.40367 Transcript_19500/m.40367 type:complete len:309 (+) Transcript_19500:719-1645(+)